MKSTRSGQGVAVAAAIARIATMCGTPQHGGLWRPSHPAHADEEAIDLQTGSPRLDVVLAHPATVGATGWLTQDPTLWILLSPGRLGDLPSPHRISWQGYPSHRGWSLDLRTATLDIRLRGGWRQSLLNCAALLKPQSKYRPPRLVLHFERPVRGAPKPFSIVEEQAMRERSRRSPGGVHVRKFGSDLVEVRISVVDVKEIARRGRSSARDSALRALSIPSVCAHHMNPR